MKSKWTNISRVLFYISFVLGFIGMLVGAIVLWSTGGAALQSRYTSSTGGLLIFLGFVVLIVGTVMNIAAHSLWGMLIEMSDNIRNQGNSINNGYNSAPVMQQAPVIQQSAPAGMWTCPHCRMENPADARFCQGCGDGRQ